MTIKEELDMLQACGKIDLYSIDDIEFNNKLNVIINKKGVDLRKLLVTFTKLDGAGFNSFISIVGTIAFCIDEKECQDCIDLMDKRLNKISNYLGKQGVYYFISEMSIGLGKLYNINKENVLNLINKCCCVRLRIWKNFNKLNYIKLKGIEYLISYNLINFKESFNIQDIDINNINILKVKNSTAIGYNIDERELEMKIDKCLDEFDIVLCCLTDNGWGVIERKFKAQGFIYDK